MERLDEFRFQTLRDLAGVKSFQKTWPHLLEGVDGWLGATPSAERLFELGDHLSEIFLAVPEAVKASRIQEAIEDEAAVLLSQGTLDGNAPVVTSARSQRDVSVGGTVWECLVTWYLNLICFGSEVVVVKRTKKNTPSVIYDATAVTQNTHTTNTESDVVMYSVDRTLLGTGALSLAQVDRLIRADTQKTTVAIVQCKTNWNDNAQIPMLWDLIYRSLPFVQVSSVQVGQKGLSPRSFKNESVKYAFVTVPTNRKMKYTHKSTPVNRVAGLSGGNYWGKPTSSGVARGLSELVGYNFGEYFTGSIQNHVDRETLSGDILDRFRNLNF
jgi:hypothetical protein